LLTVVLLAGCSTLKRSVVSGVADQLAAQGAAVEEDLGLAREASAFYLKLSESLLAEQPGHLGLATSVASGFTQYAYAFVAFEAEKLENQDARAAQRGRERAARLYARAQRHAFAALGQRHPGLLDQLATGAPLPKLNAEERQLAYWGAVAWGAGIGLSTNDPERVADLPAVARLAAHIAAAEPGLGDGDLQALLGRLEASRPGGSTAKAQLLFDAARRYGAERNAGIYLAEAEAIALPAGDRVAFETLLRQALAAAAARRTLANELMRERASWLLATLDDRF
jgi:predicted anti-sigma-YlaC factor YlaD